jgi:hypothetical protein
MCPPARAPQASPLVALFGLVLVWRERCRNGWPGQSSDCPRDTAGALGVAAPRSAVTQTWRQATTPNRRRAGEPQPPAGEPRPFPVDPNAQSAIERSNARARPTVALGRSRR